MMRLVQESDKKDFDKKVNELIQQGFKPHLETFQVTNANPFLVKNPRLLEGECNYEHFFFSMLMEKEMAGEL